MIQRAQPKRRAKRTPIVKKETVRVAAYARISVADREGSQLTSIAAQVESVTSYIKAHATSGWALTGEPYVDDGFTGANTQRPALDNLLRDVEAGLLDVVVVHRFDRFSRSQRDFLNLLHVLDEHGVAFVSVNETLDTGTPMGRCMLGVMTAFAQLERETIAARTKSKMLASRRKGFFTGGPVPLGYDLVNKRLLIKESEAEHVRAAFTIYLERQSLLLAAEELTRRGIRTKQRTDSRGQLVGGLPFTKTSLHLLLRNPTYSGRIRAGDEIVEAQHEAIVPEELWQRVQELLDAGAPGGERRPYRPTPNGGLLAGLVICAACGASYGYTYAGGKKRRWSYLVCGTVQKRGTKACPGSRVAAGEFETFIFEKIRAVGRDRGVFHATRTACPSGTDPEELRAAVRELDAIWETLFPHERARVIALLIEEIRFDARSGDCSITFREGAPKAITKS